MTDLTNWQLEESAGASPEEHLAGRHRDGWISVKDRLPENCEGVIVTDGDAVNTGDCENGDWLIDSPWEVDPDRVTHWMPLPPPPKAQS